MTWPLGWWEGQGYAGEDESIPVRSGASEPPPPACCYYPVRGGRHNNGDPGYGCGVFGTCRGGSRTAAALSSTDERSARTAPPSSILRSSGGKGLVREKDAHFQGFHSSLLLLRPLRTLLLACSSLIVLTITGHERVRDALY